jgi:hypothetical protein
VRDDDATVERSQQRWRAVRGHLNAHRVDLTAAALRLYPAGLQVEGTALIARPDWLPAAPVDVAAAVLDWSNQVPPAGVTGEEDESSLARPLRAPGERYRNYAEAMQDLDRPRLFENRTSYRLLEVDWSCSPRLVFGRGRYFDVLNVCEAAAHELTELVLRAREPDDPAGAVARSRLPLRSLIGDPLDLKRRSVVPAVSALTLRRDRAARSSTFVLHWRDPSRVASGGGLYQVMPVGVFQPAGESPADLANDFDLWRGMAREYSEEFLGEPERRGEARAPIAYGSWPFYRALEAARSAGRVRACCLGIGVDPLTLVTDILMAVVIDSDVFDDLFARLGAANDEGRIVRAAAPGEGAAGIVFSADSVDVLTSSRPMQPAGAAVLRLAWRHRDVLLS